MEDPRQTDPADARSALRAFLERALTVEFRAAMTESLQMPLEARLLGLEECAESDFLRSAEEPSCCVAIVASPAPARASRGADAPAAPKAEEKTGPTAPVWLEVSPQIAFPIIDRLLGGSGRDWYVPSRPLTAIERRLLLRVAAAAAAALEKAGARPDEADASAPRPEAPPRLAWSVQAESIPAAPAPSPDRPPVPAPVVLAKFTLTMGRQAGAVRLCLPRTIVQALAPEGSAQAGGGGAPCTAEPEPIPVSSGFRSAGPLELSVVVQDISLTDEEFAQLQVGDVLVTDTAGGGEVLLRIGGIPRFWAQLGASSGRKAVRITRRVE